MMISTVIREKMVQTLSDQISSALYIVFLSLV